MSWNFIGKAKADRAYVRTSEKRTAPARVYHAPPSFADHIKKPKRIVGRAVNPDLPKPKVRQYSNPMLPGQGQQGQTAGAGKEGAYAVDGRKIKQVISKFDLGTQHTDYPIKIDGNIFVYNDSTLGTDRIQVRLARFDGDQTAQLMTIRPGQIVNGEGYHQVLITNAAQAGSLAEFWIAEASVQNPLEIR